MDEDRLNEDRSKACRLYRCLVMLGTCTAAVCNSLDTGNQTPLVQRNVTVNDVDKFQTAMDHPARADGTTYDLVRQPCAEHG